MLGVAFSEANEVRVTSVGWHQGISGNGGRCAPAATFNLFRPICEICGYLAHLRLTTGADTKLPAAVVSGQRAVNGGQKLASYRLASCVAGR